MISARFAGASAIAVAALTVTATEISAHVPGHGPGHNMLAAYEDFINLMKRPDGMSCCHLQDGIGFVPEKPLPGGAYSVTIPMGTIPQMAKSVVLEVPASKVLSAPHARAVCKELAPKSETCVAPPFNIIWLLPSSINSNEPTVYCYWPMPQFTENKEENAPTVVLTASGRAVEGAENVKPEHAAFIRSVSAQFIMESPAPQPAMFAPAFTHH
jgi:hypothetical protein